MQCTRFGLEDPYIMCLMIMCFYEYEIHGEELENGDSHAWRAHGSRRAGAKLQLWALRKAVNTRRNESGPSQSSNPTEICPIKLC